MKYIILHTIALTVLMVGVGMPTSSAEAMNKAELIEAMASHAGLSKADAKKALEGFVGSGAKALKKGDRLSLADFGSLGTAGESASNAPNLNVQFFPSTRETAAMNRHQGNTVTGEEIMAEVFGKCATKERTERCPGEVLLGSLLAVTEETLLTGESVEWGDLGVFELAIASSISKRSARTGRNPQTGKEIQIAAKNTVKFKAGAELSKAVN